MSKHNKAVNSPMGQPISPQRQNPIYPKPTVPVAIGEFLSPKQVTAAGLEVVVTYPSIKPGDMIALTFNDVDTFVPIVVGNQTSVSFWVSVPHIIRALETTVDIHYTLSGQSGGQRSDILQLTVLPFMEGDSSMATITQATPGVLDLSTFTGDAETKIAPWALMSAGQNVWLDLVYQKDETTWTVPIIAGDEVRVPEMTSGITRSIARTELMAVPDRGLIKLPLLVDLNGSGNRANAIPFKTMEVLLRQEEQESIALSENFNGHEPGARPSPFETDYLTFVGQNMSIRGVIDHRFLRVGDSIIGNSLDIEPIQECTEIAISLWSDGPSTITCFYDNGKQEVKEISSNDDYIEYKFNQHNITKATIKGSSSSPIYHISAVAIRTRPCLNF